MGIFWVILLGGLAFGGTAEARLGESKEQVIARYGKPLHERVEGDWSRILCSKDGYKFEIYILNNRVERIDIEKKDMTEEQVKIILSENSAGKGFEEDGEWHLLKKEYVEADTGRIARWMHFLDLLGIFTKVSIQAIERGEKIFWLKSDL